VQSLLYHAKPFLNPQGFGNFISYTHFFAPIEVTESTEIWKQKMEKNLTLHPQSRFPKRSPFFGF